MSYFPIKCDTCKNDKVFANLSPMGEDGRLINYAVSWKCLKCNTTSLDICPFGPFVPTESTCLNCGTILDIENENAQCVCGLYAQESLTLARNIDDGSDQPYIKFFEQGLYRIGFLVLNYRLIHNPQEIDFWTEKAFFLERLGYSKAKQYLLEDAIDAKGPALLNIKLACHLQNQDQHEEAIQVYQNFRKLENDGEWLGVSFCNEANSHSSLGDKKQAEKLYNKAIEYEPDRITHWINRINFFLKYQRFIEAQNDIEKALLLEGEPAYISRLYQNQAYIYAENENGESALSSIEKAINLGEESIETHYLHGRALALTGDLAGALEKMNLILSLDPENADAKNAKAKIESIIPVSKPWWKFWEN